MPNKMWVLQKKKRSVSEEPLLFVNTEQKMEYSDFKCSFYRIQAAYIIWGATSSAMLSCLVRGSPNIDQRQWQQIKESVWFHIATQNSPHGWHSGGACFPRCPVSALIKEQHTTSDSSICTTLLCKGQGHTITTGRREIRAKCFTLQTPRNRK